MGDRLTIRDFDAHDMGQIESMHDKMALGYPFPQNMGPLFCVRKAVVDENGTIVGAATLKLTSEAFLWVDPSVSTVSRTKSIILLNAACAKEAQKLGLDDVSAWIPPKLMRCFKGALAKLGWKKSPWRNWSFIVK